MSDKGKVLDDIWCNEPNVYIRIREGEYGKRIIEIHNDGRMGQDSVPIAVATIENFRRERIVKAFESSP